MLFKSNNESEFVFSEEFVGFTAVPNIVLNDKRLSYKAQGLYVQLLQYQNSPGHKIYQSTLVKCKKDGKDSVASAIKELIKYGYLKKIQLKDSNGRFCGVKYIVYLNPKNNENNENNENKNVEENDEKSSNIKNATQNGKSVFGTESEKSELENTQNGKSTFGNLEGGKDASKKTRQVKHNTFIKKCCYKQNKDKDNKTSSSCLSSSSCLYKLPEITNLEYKEVIESVNSIFTQKTISSSSMKLKVNDVIDKLKQLSIENITKLIDYVYNTYEAVKDNIKNKVKYINAIFINSLVEESYLIEKQIEINNNNNNNNNNNYNNYNNYRNNNYNNYNNYRNNNGFYKRFRNPFAYQGEKPIDYELLEKIERQSLLEGIDDDEDLDTLVSTAQED